MSSSTSSFLTKFPDKPQSTPMAKKRHRLGKYSAKTAVTVKKIGGNSILGIMEKDRSQLDRTTTTTTAMSMTVRSKGAVAKTETNPNNQQSSTPIMPVTYSPLTTSTMEIGVLLSHKQQQHSVFQSMPTSMMTGDDPLQMTVSNCLKMDR
jgi:hypothetical protein